MLLFDLQSILCHKSMKLVSLMQLPYSGKFSKNMET